MSSQHNHARGTVDSNEISGGLFNSDDSKEVRARSVNRYAYISHSPYVVLPELCLPITEVVAAHCQNCGFATRLRSEDPLGDTLQ